MWFRIQRGYGKAREAFGVLLYILGTLNLVTLVFPALRSAWLLIALILGIVALYTDAVLITAVYASQWLAHLVGRARFWPLVAIALLSGVGMLTYLVFTEVIFTTAARLSEHGQQLLLVVWGGVGAVSYWYRIKLDRAQRDHLSPPGVL